MKPPCILPAAKLRFIVRVSLGRFPKVGDESVMSAATSMEHFDRSTPSTFPKKSMLFAKVWIDPLLVERKQLTKKQESK